MNKPTKLFSTLALAAGMTAVTLAALERSMPNSQKQR